ncbi:MAG: glycosyltransferase family 4 protein [Ramlibacter sp.]|nr:glycosyltransferase family 4 protein [Cryobacterium sp.]
MTRVLVDLLFYTGTKGGMESYAREVYSRIGAFAPGVEFIGFASRELAATGAPWFPGALVDSGISGESRAAWAWGELTAVGRSAVRLSADVIHSPANIGPWRSAVPLVVTTHDMLPFRFPQYVPGPYAPVLRALMRFTARAATRVITISDASRAEIEQFVPQVRGRIDVIPLAGSARAATIPVPRRRDLILALGNRLPHKNFAGLIRSLALIDPAERPTLVVSGSRGDDPLTPLVAELGLTDSVRLEGWISDDALDDLFASAGAVVVPSFVEGFGLPALEAMAHGCPVLCADIPALREVASDATAYFDPADPASIAATISATLADPALLERMSRDGLTRSALFSWDHTAELTARSLLAAARVQPRDAV